MQHKKEKMKGKGQLILMLSEKRGEFIFLNNKTKVSLKSNLFQRKYTIHPFHNNTHIHIAYSPFGNKKRNIHSNNNNIRT